MFSGQITFSLATLGGIVVIAILRSYLRSVADKKNIIFITHNARKLAPNEKDIICPQSANKKDIISQLPVDILISILTRLPTISAVRTSILSKRWRSLYKFVSDISFCCHSLWHPSFYPCDHDVDIFHRMERFLRLRSGSKIRSFRLCCRLTKSFANQFEQCIYSLRRFGVEELVVYFSCCKSFPCGKFSCCRRSSDLSFSCQLLSEIPSLKYLRLGSCSLLPNLKSQCNPLQTLSLTYVTVFPGALECILSNCLMLQSVIIDRCDCPSKLCFHCPNLQLKSLIIQDCDGVKEIEFYASNLITFELHDPWSRVVNCIFDHVPQLQNVHLDSYDKTIISYVFGKLAKDVPRLQSLAIYTRDDFDQGIRGLMGMRIETFGNLRRLELKVYCTLETDLFVLTPFLESCPLLQEFHLLEFHLSEFHLDIPYNLEYDLHGAQHRQQVVLHSELKKVEISGFSGTKEEVEFALYILKSAVTLEQMRIIWRFNCYYDNCDMRHKSRQHKTIEDQLQGLALSKTAQVTIGYALSNG